jgi:hypothetical protein
MNLKYSGKQIYLKPNGAIRLYNNYIYGSFYFNTLKVISAVVVIESPLDCFKRNIIMSYYLNLIIISHF